MKIETKEILSVTNANMNFPKFMMNDLDQETIPDITPDEIINIMTEWNNRFYLAHRDIFEV